MFSMIMVPVDLRHQEQIGRSLNFVADLAKRYDIPVCYVGVTTSQPSEIAHTPKEFEEKLADFADSQAREHGLEATSKSFIGHDLVTDVDDVLLRAVKEIGADLVVMATHTPTFVDYIWPSNGGKVASHSEGSVFLVR